MESITKNGVSAITAAAMTRRAFDAEPLEIGEMQGGFFGAVYKIQLSYGEIVLKVAPDDAVRVMRYEKNLMEAEITALKKISEFKYVPVPHVLFYDRSREIINSEYFFMELMPGVPFCDVCEGLTTEKQSELFNQTGVYSRKINSITGEYYGSLSVPGKRFSSWSRAFYSMIDDLLLDAEDMNVELPVDFDRIRSRIEREAPLLDRVEKPSLLHKDLWIGNILVDALSAEITGIVDCERAIFGDALMEPVCGILDGNEDFVCSYTSGSGFNREERLRMALYRIYIGLIGIIECPFRRYPSNETEIFAKGQLEQGLREYEIYKGEPFC